MDRSLSTISVINQQELNNALNDGTLSFDINSDITISIGMNISSTTLSIFGNNHTINGPINGLKTACFTINSYSDITINNLTISGCGTLSKFNIYGGAFYVSPFGILKIVSSNLFHNIGYIGGAIYSDYYSTLYTVNVLFDNNIAIDNLATIAAGGSTYYGSKTIFSNNFAGGYGGSFGLYYSIGILDDIIVINNNAVYEGGGIVMVQSTCTLSNSLITKNSAGFSGGIGIYSSSTFEATNINIISNIADIAGGGIAISTDAQLSIINSNISYNKAPAGGGIASDSADMFLTNVSFMQNIAQTKLTFSLLEGNCTVSNGCFYSPNFPNEYPNNENCVFQSNADGILDVKTFFTEGGQDILTINNIEYSGYEGPNCVNVSKDENILWNPNNIYQFPGFEICFTELLTGGGVTLDGNVEGTNAVISQCNSKCGPGKIGNCSVAGEYAPSCYVNCECYDCPAGTYSTASGGATDTCHDCPATKSSYAGSSSCDIADEGYYIDNNGTSQECPDHAYCGGGLQLPRPETNFWIDRTDETKVAHLHKCYRDTCKGSLTSEESCWLSECYGHNDNDRNTCTDCDLSSNELQCTEGARGPLCGSCSEGYSYSSSTKKCLACDIASITYDESIIVATLLFIFILISCGLYYGYDYLSKEMKENKLILLIQNVIKAVIRHSDSGALRVLWVNYQILDSISWTLEIDFPSPFTEYLKALHFVSFDLFILDCFPGGYLISVYV